MYKGKVTHMLNELFDFGGDDNRRDRDDRRARNLRDDRDHDRDGRPRGVFGFLVRLIGGDDDDDGRDRRRYQDDRRYDDDRDRDDRRRNDGAFELWD